MNKALYPINYKWLVVCAVTLFIFSPAVGNAQTKTNIKGEVININHHLQVAFVDIDQRNLNKGDVGEVQVGYQETVFMEVFESSAVISKIGVGPVVKRNFDSDISDFEQIKIGNTVNKVAFRNPYAQEVSIDKETDQLTEASHEISLQLEESIKEIEQLKDADKAAQQGSGEAVGEGQSCQADMARCIEKNKRLEKKISILRERLEYINELISKNIQN